MITSHSRGWEIYYKDGKWYYSDDNSLFVVSEPRPCKKCRCYPTKEGYDACLGYLPNVTHACCGHGVSEPYVVYVSVV